MSRYSDLDAHSRTCPSCIRQRELSGCKSDSSAGKKLSLQCTSRKLSESRLPVRRSTSSLTASDLGLRSEDTCFSSAYLTPTQRKNNEIKRLRGELNKANEIIQARDKEIANIRSELAKYKEGVVTPDLGEEANSIPDSGNCDWESEQEHEARTNNIDFELMESTLKEEEECRQQLQSENDDLQQEVERLQQKVNAMQAEHEEKLTCLQDSLQQELERTKALHVTKLEDLLGQLSESTVRYARQQEQLEMKQTKLDQLQAELTRTSAELTSSEQSTLQSNKHSQDIIKEKEGMIENLKRELDLANSRPPNGENSSRENKSTETVIDQHLSKEIENLRSLNSSLEAKIKLLKVELEQREKILAETSSELESSRGRETRTAAELEKSREVMAAAQPSKESAELVMKRDLKAEHRLSVNTVPEDGFGAKRVESDSWPNPLRMKDTEEEQTTSEDVVTQSRKTSQRDSEIQVNMYEDESDHYFKLTGAIAEQRRLSEEAANGQNLIYTFQFLKRSMYYFLTDKEHRDYHLRSIERLLQFSDGELDSVDRYKPQMRY